MRISEIFVSINGEVSHQHQGSLCTFVRFAGCNFAAYTPTLYTPCSYCDTPHALTDEDSTEMNVEEVIEVIKILKNTNIVITGGEPLLQQHELLSLVHELRHTYNVSVETNGSIAIPYWYLDHVSWVVDYKMPSSGNFDKMVKENYVRLRSKDIVKFVIADHNDFVTAVDIVTDLRYLSMTFAFSPCSPVIPPEMLYLWMQDSDILKRKGAVLSLQIHKIIKVK